MQKLTFNSRRSEYANGYLEFIWPTNLQYEGMPIDEDGNPECVAIVADRALADRPLPDIKYSGCFGRHVVWGRTVAECKQSLFAVIDAHFNEYGTVYGVA